MPGLYVIIVVRPASGSLVVIIIIVIIGRVVAGVTARSETTVGSKISTMAGRTGEPVLSARDMLGNRAMAEIGRRKAACVMASGAIAAQSTMIRRAQVTGAAGCIQRAELPFSVAAGAAAAGMRMG